MRELAVGEVGEDAGILLFEADRQGAGRDVLHLFRARKRRVIELNSRMAALALVSLAAAVLMIIVLFVVLVAPLMTGQFDAVTAQAKDLAEHAQKVATKTAEPIKESFSTVFSKAA